MLMKIRKMIKKNDDQKGFTIIELVIVMAILAVLAAVAVPKFSTVLNDSKTKAHQANLKMLQDAVDLYITNSGVAASTVDDFTNVTGGNYLKVVPASPTGGAAYTVTDGVVGGGV